MKENAYVGLTRVLLTQQKSSEVVLYGEKGIKNSPHNGSLWAYVAVSKYKLGDKKGALLAAQEAHTYLHNQSSQKLLDIITHDKQLDLRQ